MNRSIRGTHIISDTYSLPFRDPRLDDVMDFVFIDGPHTYANVRNDFLAK